MEVVHCIGASFVRIPERRVKSSFVNYVFTLRNNVNISEQQNNSDND